MGLRSVAFGRSCEFKHGLIVEKVTAEEKNINSLLHEKEIIIGWLKCMNSFGSMENPLEVMQIQIYPIR